MNRPALSAMIPAFMLCLYTYAQPTGPQHKYVPPGTCSVPPVSPFQPKDAAKFAKSTLGSTPTDMRIPAEWEESMAVLLRWHYYSGNADTLNMYNTLYASLVDIIQNEAEVWIVVYSYSDSTMVKSHLASKGVSLYNYQFFSFATNGIWMRDYGPIGFYYSSLDSLGFLDMAYYCNRPDDDAIPLQLSSELGASHISTPLANEGGNLMVDGKGRLFFADKLLSNNTNINTHSPPWSIEATRDEYMQATNSTDTTVVKSLTCDGGTGHIDIFAKLISPTTMIVSEYPEGTSTSGTLYQDLLKLDTAANLFSTIPSGIGGLLNVHRVPMPRRNDGTFSTTCAQVDADIRGYVNGLIVNKTFIVPIYSNAASNFFVKFWDEEALKIIRALMPGYNVVGVDARILTPYGGAIHCITMQVPTDNPVNFVHTPTKGYRSLRPQYHLKAEISNKSGIDTVACYWRKSGSAQWNSIAMADSAGYFVCAIPNTDFTIADTVRYYLQALTNNGKTSTLPLASPGGAFAFYFDQDYEPNTLCQSSTGLSTTNITSTSVKLNFNITFESALIRGGIVGMNNTINTTVQYPSTSLAVNGLQPNTDYFWQIQNNCQVPIGIACDQWGCDIIIYGPAVGYWSEPINFKTLCGTPTGLGSNNVTASSATINWNNMSGNFGYHIRGRVQGTQAWQSFIRPQNTTSMSTGSTLTAGTTFEVQIRTFCNAAKTEASAWSASHIFSTQGPSTFPGGWSEENASFEAIIYPNPSEGNFKIEVWNIGDNLRLSVYDLTGREVSNAFYPNTGEANTFDLNLTHLPKSIYLIALSSGGVGQIEKVVIQ